MTKGDIGIGAILGSAVLNVLFVIGVSGIYAATVSTNNPLLKIQIEG